MQNGSSGGLFFIRSESGWVFGIPIGQLVTNANFVPIELGYILRCEIFKNAKISIPNEIPMAAYLGLCTDYV